MHVELLLVQDCPNAEAARITLRRGVAQSGLDVAVSQRVGDSRRRRCWSMGWT